MNLDTLIGEKSTPKKDTMLIIDFSQIAFASYFIGINLDRNLKSDEEKIAMHQYMMLNSIRKLNVKFQPNELIIATDGGSWRKSVHPYYKARRKIARETKEVNYDHLFESINTLIADMKQVLPYKVIQVQEAEGDDVIAAIIEEQHSQYRDIIIASGDKDLQQLQKYKNVRQWNPIQDKFVKCDDPHLFYLEHILKGDGSDDIPNLLSDSDVFINENKRQKQITKKVKDGYFTDPYKYITDNNLIENFERNEKCIKLSKDVIPADIYSQIIYNYNIEPVSQNYMLITKFLAKKKIKSLVEKVDEFYVKK